MTSEPKPVVRAFDTGATRDVDFDKFDFEAFLSPLVIEKYGEYMHGKRKLADGTLRDGDNWQKGIPLDAYMKSSMRHQFDWWKHHRGYPELTTEDLVDTLCAQMFNTMGYLHEVLKAQRAAEADQGTGDVIAPKAVEPVVYQECSDGWTLWVGGQDGQMPVEKGTLVDVRFRDGKERYQLIAGEFGEGTYDAATSMWDNDATPLDIVAYRLSK